MIAMRITSSLLILLFVHGVYCPPVTPKKSGNVDTDENEIKEGDSLEPLGLEYNRYLKEVVTALESDPEFRAKLDKAGEVDIRTGKIAQELEYVNHQIRTKLDELKRQELERLRHLASKEYELRKGIDTDHLKIPPEHLDHSNPHTFEIEDLRKLIAKTTADLAEADKKRREEFKEYEMQKEFEKQEQMKELDEEHKKQLENEIKEKELKHKKHDPLHHPGSKQQLEEVWEKQDHMQNQEFEPKTFFHLHDLDGNGVWDEGEVKALFLKELDKLYNSGAPEDDMRERAEEMERMREHVFAETDTNKDGLISYEEFLAQTQKPDFEKDNGWETIDQQQVYTPEEYQEFERRRHEEVQRMIAQGLIPPQPHMPQGYHQQGMPQHQPQFHPGQMHPGQMHAGQMPQGQMHSGQIHPGQMQQGQIHPGQMPQGQIHPGQMPQGQIHPGQMQQGQVHPGQMQQGQVHPGQMPQGQVHHGQMPQGQVHHGQMPQGQIHPGQMQQGQVHPGQMPQGQIHHGQMPQGQIHHGQMQQGQYHPSQLPQGQYPVHQPQAGQNQINQGQLHPAQGAQGHVQSGQVPQGHVQPGQVPQGGLHPAQVAHGQVQQGHPAQTVQGAVPPDQTQPSQSAAEQVAHQQHIQQQKEQQGQAIVQQHHQPSPAQPQEGHQGEESNFINFGADIGAGLQPQLPVDTIELNKAPLNKV